MIAHTFDINYVYGETIKIKPMFDVHLGHRMCDVKAFRYFLDNSDYNTYFFGGGDLHDSIVVKDGRYQKAEDVTKSSAIIDEQVDLAEDLLRKCRRRIIGLGMGNHEWTILDKAGSNLTARICRRLGVKNLGFNGLIRLRLRENGARVRTVTIRWHHGWGGATRTEGGSITKYSKDLPNFDADVFCYGHDHQKWAKPICRLGYVGGEIVAKDQWLMDCGTFQKTFSDDADPPWSERMGFKPTVIGGLTLNIKPNNQWVDMWVDVR